MVLNMTDLESFQMNTSKAATILQNQQGVNSFTVLKKVLSDVPHWVNVENVDGAEDKPLYKPILKSIIPKKDNKNQKKKKQLKFGTTEVCFFNKSGLVCDQQIKSRVDSKDALQKVIRQHKVSEIEETIIDLESRLNSCDCSQEWRSLLHQITSLSELLEVLRSPLVPSSPNYIGGVYYDDEELDGMNSQEIWENECEMEDIFSGFSDDFQ